MSDEISPELFKHLVELAALELDANEAEYLRQQLNNQLKAIHELETISESETLGQTSVASHGIPYPAAISAPLRHDELAPYPDPARLLAGAPETEDGYIIVPDIPHQDLK